MRSLLTVTVVTAIAAFSPFLACAQEGSVGAGYGTRDPATCASRSAPPATPQVATVYVRCSLEHEDVGDRTLVIVTDLEVQVAQPRAFVYARDASLQQVDNSKPVYDIRGSYRQWDCWRNDQPIYARHPGHACRSFQALNATGMCWSNTFGDWHCNISPGNARVIDRDWVPPPR